MDSTPQPTGRRAVGTQPLPLRIRLCWDTALMPFKSGLIYRLYNESQENGYITKRHKEQQRNIGYEPMFTLDTRFRALIQCI